MGFFDAVPQPEPPPEPEYRPPEWAGPPENVLPVTLALDARVLDGDDLVVALGPAAVYRTGVAFELVVVRRHDLPPERWHHPFPHPGEPGAPRFGVGFADGRRVEAGRPSGHRGEGAPDIVLMHRSGGGGQRRWSGRLWLWPLPPEGPLTFAFAWPQEGVEETTIELDSAPIREAAARAVQLWPDDRPPRPRLPGEG